MAVAIDSVEKKGDDEKWDMPKSPGAGYGLTDDFDPAKYDFYNPTIYSARGAVPGPLTESYSPIGSKHREEKCRLVETHHEGSPEPLSPIEELDDDARPLHPPWQSNKSTSPLSRQHEFSRSALEQTVKSGHTKSEEQTRGLLPLEVRTELLFSRRHLQAILADRILALKFMSFLHVHRPKSVSILTYYLGAVNALKALKYAQSIIDRLEAVANHSFTNEISHTTMAWVVEDKIARALDVLVQEDIPAFIAYTYVETIDLSLDEKMNGRQDPTSRAVPDGLAEAFVISDPASPDNPIVFTSEGFHSLTGYCRKDILGRNCRMLSGHNTNPCGRKRFKSALDAESEHCEILLNYRQDGSPFVNLVMCVPLRDKSNRVRYYLGAQLDVTDLVSDCTGFTSLRQVVEREGTSSDSNLSSDGFVGDDFAELTKVFTAQEFEDLVALKGNERNDSVSRSIEKGSCFGNSFPTLPDPSTGDIIPALGFYQNYILARPHPSLRVLFTSPRLRSSGILQQPLLHNIGGSSRVRHDLARALEMGRKVTAKVQWLSQCSDPTECWLHCTPLLGVADSIGVWIIILVDVHSRDDISKDSTRAPHLQVGTLNGDQCAADPTPWDKTRKDESSSQASIPIRNEGARNVQDAQHILQAAPNGPKGITAENDQGLSMLKARLNSPNQAGSKVSNRMVEGNRTPVEKEVSVVRQKPGKGSAIQQTFGQNAKSGGESSRPLSTGSYKASVQSIPQLAVKVAAGSSDGRRVGKPAPIKMPGPPPSSMELDDKGLLPVRKRTYKSLSPYGIIFDT